MTNIVRVFIGSSSEGMGLADAVFAELEQEVEPVAWDRAFRPTRTTLDELRTMTESVDFAVFVLSSDDSRTSRGTTAEVPRDNVIAEIFMFIGALGVDRVFIIGPPPSSSPVALPSDLAGVTLLPIRSRDDNNSRLMVRSACLDVKGQIRRVGLRSRSQPESDNNIEHGSRVPITDIRGPSVNAAPPESFLRNANRELLLTGLSARNTLRQLGNELIALLDRGITIAILILHPQSQDIARIEERELVRIRHDIEEARRILATEYQSRYSDLFFYRFLRYAPPFTGVMRDGGALIRNGPNPAQEGGAVRIQPRSAHATQHRGLIFTFQHGDPGSPSAYDFFSDDLRLQWDNALRPS